MAGLFRAPKPVVVPPQLPAPTPEPTANPSAQAAQAAETARSESRASARQGTITTSARGVLAPLPVALTRKSLLGE
ncbi:hypothetical protein KTR66_02235 [Roseococcus sp. SDR]|uniref:hypothetical protein n=1 Tax=Roseococcus sp. SDR TaxID=2835532 RepID=UPI001BD0C7B1|nr:hypothetical protein [Roseococcus sp. SDR]MBS7788794.1 hypothetical protein [Roseococcus sp. SDR]MBV1844108.1 hypothetical protein [Roseococcus sp. SDR]